MLITTTTRILKISFRCVFLCFCVYMCIYTSVSGLIWGEWCDVSINFLDYFFFVCVSLFVFFFQKLSLVQIGTRDVLVARGESAQQQKQSPRVCPPPAALPIFFFFLRGAAEREQIRKRVCFCRFFAFYPFRHFWKEAQAAAISGKDTLPLCARACSSKPRHTYTHALKKIHSNALKRDWWNFWNPPFIKVIYKKRERRVF